jgi:hypothetical protein
MIGPGRVGAVLAAVLALGGRQIHSDQSCYSLYAASVDAGYANKPEASPLTDSGPASVRVRDTVEHVRPTVRRYRLMTGKVSWLG